MPKAQKEYNAAIAQLEKLLTEGDQDAFAIQKRTAIPSDTGELQVPTAVEHRSMDTRLMGHWETLARNYLDLSYRPLQTLLHIGAAAEAEYNRLRFALANRTLDALMCEVHVYARTNQSGQPPERQRTAASFQPLMERLGSLFTPAEQALRYSPARLALQQLVQLADPDLAVQAETNLKRKAHLKRTRVKYELAILIFFVAVVGVIIVYYKSPLNTNIERGNSPFSVPIEERAGEARTPR
jgi:hypothetical protein